MAKYKLLYKLNHANGALVDESGDTPFEFEIGDGQLDPCLESCIENTKIGKLQTFLLSYNEAVTTNNAAIAVFNLFFIFFSFFYI